MASRSRLLREAPLQYIRGWERAFRQTRAKRSSRLYLNLRGTARI